MKKLIFLLCLLSTFFSCLSSTTKLVAAYDWNFQLGVVQPITDKAQFSPETLSFADDSIDIKFMLEKATEVHRLTFTGILNDSSLFTPKDLTQIGFVIQNKTDFGIKIDWDDISIIFPGRIASRVIHGGTKLIDRNAAQAQTTVPPSAKIIDSLVPSDHISFTQGQYGGWETAPLFGGEDRLIWNNKEFSIFFPLEINGKK